MRQTYTKSSIYASPLSYVPQSEKDNFNSNQMDDHGVVIRQAYKKYASERRKKPFSVASIALAYKEYHDNAVREVRKVWRRSYSSEPYYANVYLKINEDSYIDSDVEDKNSELTCTIMKVAKALHIEYVIGMTLEDIKAIMQHRRDEVAVILQERAINNEANEREAVCSREWISDILDDKCTTDEMDISHDADIADMTGSMNDRAESGLPDSRGFVLGENIASIRIASRIAHSDRALLI